MAQGTVGHTKNIECTDIQSARCKTREVLKQDTRTHYKVDHTKLLKVSTYRM